MLTNIVLFLIIAIGILVFGSALYAYIRNKTLEEIREEVYKLFLEAEHMYKESGTGKQKMKWVVSMARMLLPDWAQVLDHGGFIMQSNPGLVRCREGSAR